jgi:hypothetical protein
MLFEIVGVMKLSGAGTHYTCACGSKAPFESLLDPREWVSAYEDWNEHHAFKEQESLGGSARLLS